MNRRYNVKIEGIEHTAEGGFSFGAYDALKSVLGQHFQNLEPVPGGRVVGQSFGFNVWRFEAIDHDAQMGYTVWVTETM